MNYARLGSGSDVFVFYGGAHAWVCQACELNEGGSSAFFNRAAHMLVHLQDHREAGHRVPQEAIDRLIMEISNGKSIFGFPIKP